jgi:general secretion pathway protein E
MEARQPNGTITLLSDVFEKASSLNASDIHLEPTGNGVRVRYRVDGILRDGILIHRSMQLQISSRIKVMADLDIAETRIPQDGRALMKAGNKEYDIRISVVPTLHGEKIVLRLFDRKRTTISLPELGIAGRDLDRYITALADQHGLIIVCGPTGCGKTTTLYSSLEHINNDSVNIMTVEDPIEYQLSGINQIQVNTRTGLTFAKGLRGILRQDPDIIMVGEIRDSETAMIAVQSAMTGHLVLSTLHTNNAISAVNRLKNIGIEHYLIEETLKCVISQRLVRKICALCKGTGCKLCGSTGYKGRIGLFEVFKPGQSDNNKMTDNADRLIEGGITTKEEVLRNIGNG